MEPAEMASLVLESERAWEASWPHHSWRGLGPGRKIQEVGRRSLYISRDLKAGEIPDATSAATSARASAWRPSSSTW
jgi:N-acetylneuraminate synthase